MENVCKDCKFYLPVDVFQGLCKLEKKMLTPDDPACDKYERQQKCKFCSKYFPEKEYLGKCQGNILVYPDMNAGQCGSFEWHSKN